MSVLLPEDGPVPCAGPAIGPIRFGITVSRRQARRAVARNTVKRILREAARHGAASLATAAGRQPIDILLRLKAPLPDAGSAGWRPVKAQLRREADSLIAQLQEHLRHLPSVLTAAARAVSPEADQVLAQSGSDEVGS